MIAISLGVQAIRLEEANVLIAGGTESMSNSPHLLPTSRNGYKYGSTELIDACENDGLLDAYGSKQRMGDFAEDTVNEYGLSRTKLDDYAVNTYKRAIQATEYGYFKNEITPMEVKERKGTNIIEIDEGPQNVRARR